MRQTRIHAALATAAVAAAVTAAAADANAAGASVQRQSARAVGLFTSNLLGTSVFQQKGAKLSVNGRYAGLTPGNSYYTVIYGNSNCDPAQAFPTGYFTANSLGVATWQVATRAPAGIVAATMSMSVRMADTAADLDHDGKTGPTDVVAVPGTPSIGLVECDSTPVVSGS